MTDHTQAWPRGAWPRGAGHHGAGHHGTGPRGVAQWVAMVLAIVAALIGAVLLASGIRLIVLGGTWYDAIAGFGLIMTAVCLVGRSVLAVPVSLAVSAYTLVCACLEVGFDWWTRAPRNIAPTVIPVVILLCLPLLALRTRPMVCDRTAGVPA